MADVVTPEARSRMMSGIRSSNTRPERLVRSGLFAAGFRFRLHRRDLPGKPDLVLTKWRATIFINGCFWHAHQDCRFFRVPKSRRSFWIEKLALNRTRDAACSAALIKDDWRVITVWECALRADVATTLALLQRSIRDDTDTSMWTIREVHDQPGSIEVVRST
ncbi:very short patch repair endonuclease [Lysobacter sp. A286]